jgi:hypothetical protein
MEGRTIPLRLEIHRLFLIQPKRPSRLNCLLHHGDRENALLVFKSIASIITPPQSSPLLIVGGVFCRPFGFNSQLVPLFPNVECRLQ